MKTMTEMNTAALGMIGMKAQEINEARFKGLATDFFETFDEARNFTQNAEHMQVQEVKNLARLEEVRDLHDFEGLHAYELNDVVENYGAELVKLQELEDLIDFAATYWEDVEAAGMVLEDSDLMSPEVANRVGHLSADEVNHLHTRHAKAIAIAQAFDLAAA